MTFTSARLIYFSPTRTTQKILQGIARGFQGITVDQLDLTPPAARAQGPAAVDHVLAVVGVPVYSGRIPIEAVDRLRRLRGQNTPAAVVVVYGNRAYEDALLELRDLVLELGFRPLAAGAFIGEHSFSSPSTPIAHGRPDLEDMQSARAFGERIQEKLRDVPAVDGLPSLHVPGNFPYKERRAPSQTPPVRHEARCTMCGQCVAACPMGAITMQETVVTDPDGCVVCCACVKSCPAGARTIEDAGIRQIAERLTRNCRIRQAPEFFM